MREEHEEEREVLQSIYEGDDNFGMSNDTTFTYKYGEDGDNKSFVVEITWTEEYPDVAPEINLDVFYNKHISSKVKDKINDGLKEQAEANLGMSMTYTLFEWVKEEQEQLLEDQIADPNPTVTEVTTAVAQINVTEPEEKQKKEHLTKAQKRRMWDRQNVHGERPRGYNWVDLIKHLSQTGSSKNDG